MAIADFERLVSVRLNLLFVITGLVLVSWLIGKAACVCTTDRIVPGAAWRIISTASTSVTLIHFIN